jgi:hypothetical protein
MSTSPPSTFDAIELADVAAALSDDVVGEGVTTADDAELAVDVTVEPSVQAKWVMTPARIAAVMPAAISDILARSRRLLDRCSSRVLLSGGSGCDWG